MEEVINKINKQYAGEITEADKVMMSNLHDKLLKDKKLRKAAVNNGQQIDKEILNISIFIR